MSVLAALIICTYSRLITSLVIDHNPHADKTLETESDECDATVAYVFLARENLPLWPVWETYFKECPEGSYSVLVHTQTPGAAYGNSSLVGVSSVGGKELPRKQTQFGELRYNWNMVEAMLQLYGGVENGKAAPNGCKPHWVQMLSDACAPVRKCSEFHSYLAEHPGKSFVQQTMTNPHSDHLRKSTQWTTLWWEHATELWQDRKSLREYWSTRGSEERAEVAVAEDAALEEGAGQSLEVGAINVGGKEYHGALDEFVIATEAKKKKWDLISIALMYFQMTGNGHPHTFDKPGEVNQAPYGNSFFARKFDGSPKILEQLQKVIARHHIVTPRSVNHKDQKAARHSTSGH